MSRTLDMESTAADQSAVARFSAAMRIFHASSTKLIVTRVPVLDRERLDAIVAAIGDQLEGEWLLIGGALAALWFAPRRTTEDVDIVGLRGDPSERVALLELADSL